MSTPGAVIVGRSSHTNTSPSTTASPPLPSTPRELKSARLPSLSPAATVITHGAFLKLPVIVDSPGPELPAENTVMIPLSAKSFVTTLVGWSGLKSVPTSLV